MAKPKRKEGINKLFYLEKETIDIIKNCAKINQMSESQFVDYLIGSYNQQLNPQAKIENLKREKEKLLNEKKHLEEKEKELDNQITECFNQLNIMLEWNKNKQQKRPIAIDIIARKIKEGDLITAENYAKTWSIMTGIPAPELLYEAQKKINSYSSKEWEGR